MSKIHVEKITNEPFDDIIGHTECERKYFTIENNDIIYKRLRNELIGKDFCLPSLGPCVDYGCGNVCIEESNDIFKFYVIDRMSKFDYQEVNDIYEIIECLIQYYEEEGYITEENKADADKIREIFYDTLGLENNKVLCKKI